MLQNESDIQAIQDLGNPSDMNDEEAKSAIDLVMNEFYFTVYGVLEDEFEC
jgi:hypothetical protein